MLPTPGNPFTNNIDYKLPDFNEQAIEFKLPNNVNKAEEIKQPDKIKGYPTINFSKSMVYTSPQEFSPLPK